MPLVPHDDDDFYALRDDLSDEFKVWLETRHGKSGCDEMVSDAGIFLDWRYNYSTGVLDVYEDQDVAEFLLEWCPRKLSAPPEAADGLCRSVAAFVEFLADTNRLAGGFARAARLTTYAEELIPQMRTAMADPSNFGMAKSLFSNLGSSGDMSMDELQAAAQARMDEFNALPFEQRSALTDQFFDRRPPPTELPFTYFPPSLAELEASAAAAALPGKIEGLREYLGTGKALTQKGNLKLADGRALIELLDTGDQFDQEYGDTTFTTTTTEHLAGLTFLLDIAKQVRAVRVHQRRLVPVQAYSRRPSVERAVQLARLVVEQGPLTLRGRRYHNIFDNFDALLDSGIVHWLAPLLGADTEIEVDRIVEFAREVVDEQLGEDGPWARGLVEITGRGVSRIFTTLEAAGIVDWTDTVDVPERFGGSHPGGGVLRLTPLGRHVIADLAADENYVLHSIGDLADGDGAALIEALASVPEEQHGAVLAAWQPERSPVERIEMIVAAIAEADAASARLLGFVALEKFEPDTVAPLARQLLDSPAAGHAALWLASRDLADQAIVDQFMNVGVLVDLLSTSLDDPEALCTMFAGSLTPEELAQMLEDMWRHPAAETGEVLDALGRHLPDAKLAKAARKAAMRHRSWMANRR